jgi:hypothetical protein
VLRNADSGAIALFQMNGTQIARAQSLVAGTQYDVFG